MKKVLVLTLVLVMALAGNAMAAVTWSGDFTATGSMDSFKLFADDYELSTAITLSASATAKNETTVEGEEEDTVNLNWEFKGALKLGTKVDKDGDGVGEVTPSLGKYRLTLYDNYFTAWVWGNGEELTDKNTAFGFISAPKAASDVRARLEAPIPVLEGTKLTVDFAKSNAVKAFFNTKVSNFNLGLAYGRTWKVETDKTTSTNTLVGEVGTSLPAGDMTLNAKAAVGVDIADKLGLAVGFSADTKIIDTVKVEGSVKYGNKYWNGTGVKADTTVINGKVTYEDAALQASVDVTQTLATSNKNEITVAANYRMSNALTFSDLFKSDKWFTNNAPAFGASINFEDFGFKKVTVNAAAPVVADMVWVKANASFENKNTYGAGVEGYVKATDKLTLKPSATYAKTGSVVDLKLVSEYKIGLSDTKLTLTIQKVMAEETYRDKDGNNPAKELIQASVKVSF